MKKTYSKMLTYSSFEDRFKYLQMPSSIGVSTFGYNRYLNQQLYQSPEWRKVRNEVIVRDKSCDLACPDREIHRYVLIHHINPITVEDILNRDPSIFDLENLVCVSKKTHNAIHYSDESALQFKPVTRMPEDTKLW